MSGADMAKVKILVVDDTPAVAAMLEAADREVVVVQSCAAAVHALTVHDVAACVLSAHLDGIATAAKIHALSPVPIVLLADGEQPTAMQAYASGVVDVIARPFDAAIVRAKISVFANLHHAREREIARREAQYVDLQREFLATLGQELRPPLNVILGWIRMLREGSLRESQRARALETVERAALAQLELIEEMLDISRMTSNALTLDLALVDVRRVVAAVVEDHRPAALDKQVRLFAAIDDDVAPMSADPERLRQIVHRLVKNAVASTPTEGVVTVSLGNTGGAVELAITDTGNDGEVPSRVFDGLAIVRHLVELHDGTIRIEAAASGPGRRIVVNVPAAGRLPRTDDEAR